ncbi:MAG: hypothetical protein METHP_00872 [Methanoregula sp. SKADARSKE-2]|nr:MAG: hypothetical protein METHP_00872 [Methanoregula sp. SKADARSKE-2]
MGTIIDDPRLRERRSVFTDRHNAGRQLGDLVRTDGTNTFPIDPRIYGKDGGELSENDHLRDMLKSASGRSFSAVIRSV